MKVPNYVMEMPWFREMSRYGQLLFFDVLRMAEIQYHGMDIDLLEPRGLTISHDRCRVALSPDLFRKARKELSRHGILSRVRNEKNGTLRRDAYMFRLPN